MNPNERTAETPLPEQGEPHLAETLRYLASAIETCPEGEGIYRSVLTTAFEFGRERQQRWEAGRGR